MSANTTPPFAGTKEQERELKDVIGKHKNKVGELMPVLQAAQDIYGYMPEEVQRMVAEGMSVSLSEVFGIVTFYSQFSLTPKGKYKIKVCMGTACYVVGAGDILDRFSRELSIKDGECTEDMQFSLDGVRCIGACGLAPVITINEDVHGRINEGMVPEILSQYKS
ncbi:MAG: NAD(P)H-dependent oxidoreductase subunit E [Oscillospiraceae bacterium]|nr:NAD(P)H-dependent oxidoreductase subunit E [Oscillospiraceae bacterium]